ncbi:MAG: ATP-binding cassette domain-containing protein [Hyphomicrobium zavarzinii]|uniref:iron ABC transporter ATP-binding protein n=1 Tax=Hyphomicrobium zavarzinii TaxID=48292 RepID=UPI001A4D4684|nr:ATP-binding cassette domain-containing protein [Hyphomicrobium zavarzinii]MBL8847547.1 ATP-binding cassette domain-containing protein [Hyphomicrobium zavarzinii]
MIETKALTKSYGSAVVVDNVSLSLPRGGITSIIGANGAGKSTLLALISRLLTPTAGSVTVDGLDVATTAGDVLARRLSILRQDNHIAARLTIRDLVAFGRYPHSKGRMTAEDQRMVSEAISYLALDDIADRFLDEISGGQRQRAFVAMVLCQNTDYVLLDEPLNNLDMKHAVGMMKLLRRIADDLKKTFVIVIHDINFASIYSDRIVAMRHGVVVRQGSPAEIVRTDVLREIFGIDIAIHEVDGHRVGLYYL